MNRIKFNQQFQLRLMRRILYSGLHIHRPDKHADGARQMIVDSLGQVPAILAPGDAYKCDDRFAEMPPEIPNVHPPFPLLWMEGRGPTSDRLWGALIASREAGDSLELLAYLVGCRLDRPPTLIGTIESTLGGGDTWSIHRSTYRTSFRDEDWDSPPVPEPKPEGSVVGAAANACIVHAYPALNVLKVCNLPKACFGEVEADPAIQKRVKRRHGKPGFRFHIIGVPDGPMPRRRRNATPGELLNIMPLHDVKGHYKTFSADRPGFGWLVGQVWVDPYLKGDSKNGTILKGYLIKQSESHQT